MNIELLSLSMGSLCQFKKSTEIYHLGECINNAWQQFMGYSVFIHINILAKSGMNLKKYSWVQLKRGSIYCHILHCSPVTDTEHKSEFVITKDTRYFTLTGTLCGVHCENFGENWPRYNSTTLYAKFYNTKGNASMTKIWRNIHNCRWQKGDKMERN